VVFEAVHPFHGGTLRRALKTRKTLSRETSTKKASRLHLELLCHLLVCMTVLMFLHIHSGKGLGSTQQTIVQTRKYIAL
jgi:hypothetical protein